MINWKKIVRVDRRSVAPIAKQLYACIVQLIHEQILTAEHTLPSPEAMSQSLHISVQDVQQAYHQLQASHYIAIHASTIQIENKQMKQRHLPRPFARRFVSQSSKTIILSEETQESKVMNIPNLFLDRFPSLLNHQALFIKKQYKQHDKLVAVSEIYFILLDSTCPIEEKALEARIQYFDRFIRDIEVIPTSTAQKRMFGVGTQSLLKGSYFFQRGETIILEIGEVVTLIDFSYQKALKESDLSFMF
jgi:DNA-binding transcriptional regulator YhcF (GntR family)